MKFIKSILGWLDDRSGFSDVVMPMLRHVVPDSARWWYVFGSATLCAFAVQVISGIALATTYVPGGEAAYESLLYITKRGTARKFIAWHALLWGDCNGGFGHHSHDTSFPACSL